MNVFPTIYNTLSGWMSRYPFSSKPTSTKHTVYSWGHSSSDTSCDSRGEHSASTATSERDDLILAQIGMAWQQSQPQHSQPQPQQCHYQRAPRPVAPLSPSPSTSSTVVEEPLEEPRRSNSIFIESQIAVAAAQRRFFRSVVRATRAHLDGLVDQDEVAMFGHLYPDARARLNQGFSGQNHLRLDEWDHSLERARKEFAVELTDIMKKMQYLHVDAMRELIGQVEDIYDAGVGAVFAPVASSSLTSLPTPATSPEPSRKRSLDESDEKIVSIKADNASRPRPLKRARIETVKSEECDLPIPPASMSPSSLSAAAEALLASSSSLATPPPALTSPKRNSQTSAAPRRRRRTTRSTRSGTKKNH